MPGTVEQDHWVHTQLGIDPRAAERAFNAALREAMPAIEVARGLVAVNEIATTAHETMEAALEESLAAANRRDFTTATSALARAEAQTQIVSDERVKMREAFYDRQEKLGAALDPMADRIGKLSAVPGPVSQALTTATDAMAVAAAADGANPEDWPAGVRALDELERAIADLGTRCVDEAGKLAAGLATRFGVVQRVAPAGADFVKKLNLYATAKKKLDGLLAGKDGPGALEAAPVTDQALKAFEALASPSDVQRRQKAAAAKATLKGLSDQDLASKPLQEKAELALDLCANGEPTERDAVDQLCRLYRKSPPDPAFLDKRAQQRAAIVTEVSKMPEIDALYKPDGSMDTAAWDAIVADPDRAKALLKKICDAQTDALGIPHLDVNKDPDPPEPAEPDGSISFGGYNPASNTIDLNLHRDALTPVDEALTTILHETFHAHQDVIVKQLKSGAIAPDDPLYPTALMYLVNDIGVGYVQSDDVGQENYEKQPTEIDAEHQGKLAAQAVLLAVKTAKGGR